MTLIAIDPGVSGGIATNKGGVVSAIKMPETPMDIIYFLESLIDDTLERPGNSVKAYVERVGTYMPGNSGPAAVAFARHCGVLDAALLALRIPAVYPTPRAWMDAFIGKQTYHKMPKAVPQKERLRILAKRKTERKNKIKAKCQALWPELKITLAVADALGILWYGMREEGL